MNRKREILKALKTDELGECIAEQGHLVCKDTLSDIIIELSKCINYQEAKSIHNDLANLWGLEDSW